MPFAFRRTAAAFVFAFAFAFGAMRKSARESRDALVKGARETRDALGAPQRCKPLWARLVYALTERLRAMMNG